MSFYRFSDLEVGDRQSETVEFTPSRVKDFGAVINDHAPLHEDRDFASSMGFPGVVVHGAHVISRFSRLLGELLPGPNSVLHSLKVEVPNPVYVGQRITFEVSVKRLIPAVKTVVLGVSAANEEGKLVARGTAQCSMRREGDATGTGPEKNP